MSDNSPSRSSGRESGSLKRRAPTLYAIITIKLAKAVLLFLLAAGLFSLVGRDISGIFEDVLRWAKLDPEQRFLASLGDKIDKITPANLKWIGSGSLLYATLLLLEGAGLMRRSGWAVWLAIGETAFFIPFEVLELLNKFSGFMLCVLTVNIAMVVYLIHNRDRLFRHHHAQT
jgi:uncharacterized membrane protein (DUF2068 family)